MVLFFELVFAVLKIAPDFEQSDQTGEEADSGGGEAGPRFQVRKRAIHGPAQSGGGSEHPGQSGFGGGEVVVHGAVRELKRLRVERR